MRSNRMDYLACVLFVAAVSITTAAMYAGEKQIAFRATFDEGYEPDLPVGSLRTERNNAVIVAGRTGKALRTGKQAGAWHSLVYSLPPETGVPLERGGKPPVLPLTEGALAFDFRPSGWRIGEGKGGEICTLLRIRGMPEQGRQRGTLYLRYCYQDSPNTYAPVPYLDVVYGRLNASGTLHRKPRLLLRIRMTEQGGEHWHHVDISWNRESMSVSLDGEEQTVGLGGYMHPAREGMRLELGVPYESDRPRHMDGLVDIDNIELSSAAPQHGAREDPSPPKAATASDVPPPEDFGTMTATVSRFRTPPEVDGRISDPEWQGAVCISGFQLMEARMHKRLHGGKVVVLDPRSSDDRTYFGFDRDRLFVAVVSRLPPDGSLVAKHKRRDSSVFDDDGIEIWLDPNPPPTDSETQHRTYYQFIGNANGAILDQRFESYKPPELSWNGKWSFASRIDERRGVWMAEVSIPLSEIGWGGLDPVGRTIGVLVARNFKRPWQQATWVSWGTRKGGFKCTDQYARIRLSENEPSVRIRSLGPLLTERLKLSADIYNPGAARTVCARLHIASTDMPALSDEKRIRIGPGESAAYAFEVPAGRLHREAINTLRLRVASVDDGKTCLQYRMQWAQDWRPLTADWSRGKYGWSGGAPWEVSLGPDYDEAVKLAYYPSYGVLKLKVDARQLGKEAGEQSTSAHIELAAPNTERVLEQDIELGAPPTIRTLDVGDLGAGKYTLTVKLSNCPHVFKRTVTRKRFAWEGNSLGLTDQVFAPFEPLTVDGNKVSVVLRTYSLGGLGLPASITASGNVSAGGPEELLAQPAALRVDDGQRLTGKGSFTSATGQQAVFEGQASHPAVVVKSRTITEYDGCMRVELELAPGEEKRELRKLWLDLPIRDKMAPLWHLVRSKTIRSNPAGLTPPGAGLIWDSVHGFNAPIFYGSFLPYVWLGAEERGLCWFADNDKGWVLDVDEKAPDNSTPCLELHRGNGLLTLRVNLVQKPITLATTRKIVFGLMASPAKPMPADWRAIGRPGERDVIFMSQPMFGGDTTNGSKYPREHDWLLFDAMRKMRLAGKTLSNADEVLQLWLARHAPEGTPAEVREEVKRLAGCVTRWCSSGERGGRDGLQSYTYSKTALTLYFESFTTSLYHEESPVFYSEWGGKWLPEQFPQVHKSKADWMQTFKTAQAAPKSYRDFACWHAAEWLRRGYGIYIDNSWPQPNRDPVTSEAYRLPNGEIQPSASLWARREYLRRIWVLHQQLYDPKTPQIMEVHMTNGHVVPYMVWNEINLDLEWFYDGPLAQIRYPADLLRAESLGRKTGNIPSALARDYRHPRGVRSRFGTLMVHEIGNAFSGGIQEQPGPLKRILEQFGYGLPDCKVHNYWDRNPPATVSDEQCKWLLLQRGKRFLALLCTWRPVPSEATLTLSSAALGMSPVRAVDAENGNDLELKDGAVTVPLKDYGVRLIRIE